MPTRAELKMLAKQSMRQHKPSVYLVTLVLMVILVALELLSYKVSFPGVGYLELMDIMAQGDVDALYSMQSSGLGQLLTLAIDIMTLMMEVGLVIFCLRVSRGMEAGFGDLFDGFGMFFKFLLLNILIGVFTFLWSLLFVIPGIVAYYRYSMAIYIMIDNPEYSPMECIRLSKEMMRGHKGELFVLHLSFILWLLLCIIPVAAIYVMPYMQITEANFYNALSGSVMEAGYTPVDWDRDRDPWEK